MKKLFATNAVLNHVPTGKMIVYLEFLFYRFKFFVCLKKNVRRLWTSTPKIFNRSWGRNRVTFIQFNSPNEKICFNWTGNKIKKICYQGPLSRSTTIRFHTPILDDWIQTEWQNLNGDKNLIRCDINTGKLHI